MKKLLLLIMMLLSFQANIDANSYVIKGKTYPIPEAIDLGLPSGNKWANMNIGASSTNDVGGYYGWADPTGELTVDDYNWRNVELDGAWNSPLFGGTNPPRNISGTELDIATQKLGRDWCMPSSDDFKELTDNCAFVVESDYVRVTGPNGNSIDLPISGMWIYSGTIKNPTYQQSMNNYPCFWVSTRSFYNHDDSDYWSQYNQPGADYAHADNNGFWGADGTCDSWYRNGMIPIRAIQRNSSDYVEVCGIKWAKGNLLYDAINGGDSGFETNWKLASEQWFYFNYADGYGQQTYDQWDNQIDHFNFGVCGSNALLNTSNPTFNRLYNISGKMYTDANCTQECTDFSKALYGDIAFWASRGAYRIPTMEEYHKIGDEASISFGYCLSPDNKKVYGCLFTTPVDGNRVIDTEDKEFSVVDLNNGLFLPFNDTRLNPEAWAGHNGKLIYYGSEGSYWSSESVYDGKVAGTNEIVYMPCGFIVHNFAGTEMDDGVYTLMTYFIGGRHQGHPIRPVLVNQESDAKYILTYQIDGQVYKRYEVEYGTEITPEPEPTKEGYTFSGWSEIPETMPAHDVTVTGSFVPNNYTLTYIVDGQVYQTYSVAFGSTITPEPAPTKEGYTFSGWSYIPPTMPATDVVIMGTFSINSYTLTYMVDGEEYKSMSVQYGSTITPEAEPTKEGYTFSGWSEIPETMPAYDVTVTGTFTKDILGTCATPTISYANGELTFNSETGGVTFHYDIDIEDDNVKSGSSDKVQLSVTYHISVYATKEDYYDSEVATGTLCWIDVKPATDGIILKDDATEVKEIKALPVLIQTQGGTITIQGAAEGTPITVYDIDGKEYGSAIGEKDYTTIDTSLRPGSVAIVKIGEKSVKVLMK